MANPVPNNNDGDVNILPIAWEVVSADGALTLGKQVYHLTKATALAATLAAPTNPGMNGWYVHIVSQTAAAHVITATNLINGDNDTLTWGGAIGDSCTLYAHNGEWFTGYLTNVTVG
jgi:hypothetical protein